MRAATESEQEAFDRIAESRLFQMLHGIFAIIGVNVTWALMLNIIHPESSLYWGDFPIFMLLVMGGASIGYSAARLQNGGGR